MELTQAFEQFVKHGVYLRAWSPRTVRTYRQALGSFLRFQQSQREGAPSAATAEALTKAQFEAWVIWLRDSGCTPGGVNMYARTFNSFLSWLSAEDRIEKPIHIKLLPNPPKPLRGFSDLEIRSLLSFRPKSYPERRTFTLIATLVDTGCRIEECLTLHTSRIDLDSLHIRVVGKGNKERIVPISLELRKLLWVFINRKVEHKHGIIFCTRDGLRLSYRNTFRDIKNLCAKAGVSGSHVHPHAFRHHFAVTYIRRGGDIYKLSRILGHISLSTTQIYLRSMGIEVIAENHSSLSPLALR